MHFFTEPDKLDTQSSGQEFGAIDEYQYRLGNIFSSSATEDPKAFAITDGLVLVQKINGVDKYNIVLKPTQQPDLNFPKIDYIIYKGIKKDSIIDGTKVANENNNDLTKTIHVSAQLWYQNEGIPIPGTEPAANTSLGLIYDANASDQDYHLQDTDSLNEAFYSNNPVTLPFVFSGNHIGDFDKTDDFGIVIIFEKIGFQPTFKLARELDSVMDLAPLDPSATNADIFKRKHEKEDVLCFIDATAFFGSFFNLGLSVYNGSDFEQKEGDDLYSYVISKFLNKNKLYIDIRNVYDDSLNYYENYDNTIQWSLDNTDTLVNVNYYRNYGWPVLVINDDSSNSEFDPNNTEKVIKLAFPKGDNENPLIYYKKAYKVGLGLELPEGKDIFLTPVIQNNLIKTDAFIVPKSSGRLISNYYHIKLIKQIDNTHSQSTNGFPPERVSFLDALFPIFDMQIPFDSSTNKSYLKIYYDTNFADKTYINSSNFTANIAIAKDNISVSFVAFPNKYNLNYRVNIDDKIPLSGMEGTLNSLFLLELDKRVESVKLVQSNFLINGTDYGYLKYIEQEYPNETQIEKYTFDDISILSLTNQQYQELLQLKNQEFPDDYKVYLSLDNIINDIDDNGNSYTKFDCTLTGLKDDSSGNIISHSATPSPAITLYTDKKIFGAEYSRNYEENLGIRSDITTGLYNEDYFINLQVAVKNVVYDFITKINNINSSSGLVYQAIRALVSSKGTELWQTAAQTVQANPSQPDDRPLYWGRLKMGVAIKKHPYFRGDINANSAIIPGSRLDEIIKLFEEKSRNYTGVDFSNAPPGAKKILITGFDPFQLDPAHYPPSSIETQNPSGISTLLLHGNTVNDSSGNTGFIQAAIFPVRYIDFDNNVVEDLVTPFLNANSIDMIISLSLNGSAYYFDLERFAAKNRGGFHDNMGIGTSPAWADPTLFSQINSSGNDFYQTTLPIDKIVTAAVANNFNYNGQKVFYDQSYTAENGNARPHVSATNGQPNANVNSFSINEIVENSIGGSGGAYLSNEIFYRISRLREILNSNVKTGHYHIAKATSGYFTMQESLEEVENAIKRSLSGI